ncbi:MAG: sulfite exporter TauE/SafE family protein [Pseudomonadota bacterium]
MDGTIALILLGALAGGFVSGLTGFGTAIATLPVWLLVLPPIEAVPLAVCCAIAAQLLTLPKIWPFIEWRRVMPFLVGGLIGVPVGALILPQIAVGTFKVIVGGLLLTYCAAAWFLPPPARPNKPGSDRTRKEGRAGRIADGLVGLSGGVFGGLAGLAGIVPTIWLRWRGWGKNAQRGVFQAFNLTILSFSAVAQSLNGLLTATLVGLLLIVLPGTIAGAWLGRRLYDGLPAPRFDQAVLAILTFAALTLILGI